MNENFFLLVLLSHADVRHRYNNNFFFSLSFLSSVHSRYTLMPSINSRQSLSLSLQMGISKERAIAVINIIMSALYVCTVALFDLLSFSLSNGIFFCTLSLSLHLCKRIKFDWILFDDDRCIQRSLSRSVDSEKNINLYIEISNRKRKQSLSREVFFMIFVIMK